jgi:hypothetical protein
MKRKLSFAVMVLFPLFVLAQNSSSAVYSSDGSKITILEKPAIRKVVGGTIINVKYEGNDISNTVKGAFEYACKIWEENIPTTYPINITFRFTKFANSKCLALVNDELSNLSNNDSYDKIYVKRHAQIYGEDLSEIPEARNMNFMCGNDATISFSNTQPFDYNLDGSKINSNKYDFVTVALQAIGKVVGFCLKAYTVGNTLRMMQPNNKYTSTILSSDVIDNYTKATSGNIYIESNYFNNKWLLYSPLNYDEKYSLSYFSNDSTNKETLIMQKDVITKGTVIRYIGKGMHDFFSYCGWDYPIATGLSSENINNASTDDITSYQKPSPALAAQAIEPFQQNTTNEDIDTYLSKRSEHGEDGSYVLLKDGSWEKFVSYSRLTNNDKYARTSDGYLRIKVINITYGPGGIGSDRYKNINVSYKLYDYVPQTPEVSYNNLINNNVTSPLVTSPRNTKSNDITKVTINFKNVEGTTDVKVDQTDEDYPNTYSYYVDPSAGCFNAYMSKYYSSTFKLTYINNNGSVSGKLLKIPALMVNLNNDSLIIIIKDGDIHYEIVNSENSNIKKVKAIVSKGSYNIYLLTDPSENKNGTISNNIGDIDISDLKKGLYLININYEGKSYNAKIYKS